MLQIKDLSVKYDNIQVLHGISMDIQDGELVALIGANGAGKTTALTTISGVKRSFDGEIVYNGKNITKASTDEIVRLGVVQVPEGRQIFSKMTIEENLILGAYTESDSARQKANMERGFEMFPILRERKKQLAGTLSGGEQQMVSIARALAKNPKLLLCDEPTGALDYQTGKAILKLLQDMCREKGMTVIVITHNSALAPMADRVIRIKNGKVSQMYKNETPLPVEEIEW